MATLQAARASVLGLPEASAKSWGLNRAIFFAAAKRGFTGIRPSSAARIPKGGPAPREFLLGDDKAFVVTERGVRLFTIGGQVQRPEDFERQIAQRFAGTFDAAWAHALALVRAYPREVLESQTEFYGRVYRPRRDELAKAWSERPAGGATGAPARPGAPSPRRAPGRRRTP